MALTLTHTFVSAIPDGSDATVVRPSNWNANHTITGQVPVANGGTGVAVSTGSVAVVLSDTPTLVTPILGVATATSLAIGGATIGTNALAVTGTATISGYSLFTGGANLLNNTFQVSNSGIGAQVQSLAGYAWSSSTTSAGTMDTFLTRAAAASVRLGQADAAAPVAQTLQVQSVVAGTTNTAGTVWKFYDSGGTGTGASGGYQLYVHPAGSTGSAQNAGVLALTIDSTRLATFAGSASLAGSITAADIGAGNANALYWVGGAVWKSPTTSSVRLLNSAQSQSVDLTVGASNLLTLNGALSLGGILQFQSYINQASSSRLAAPSDGIWTLSNNAGSDFTRLQFGGTTSSFPALKRSTTSLQAKLADDSAFTAIQGKLTTDTAYTAGVQVPTGYIVIYDSTGTAYKVSVNV